MFKTTGSAGGNSKEADAASAQPKTILQKSYHRLAINQLRLVCLSGGKVKKYKKNRIYDRGQDGCLLSLAPN